VFAQDRPGLLYTITRTLSQQGLTIARAKISTEGARAIDSFYVAKRVAPEQLKEVREALESAVDAN
jgi:[protein-PII] uridylyltransferase